ncbi:MAG: hypothetical protein AAB588_03835 [Patescibacteria group bacterium]
MESDLILAAQKQYAAIVPISEKEYNLGKSRKDASVIKIGDKFYRVIGTGTDLKGGQGIDLVTDNDSVEMIKRMVAENRRAFNLDSKKK